MSLSAGKFATCALLESGRVSCWGCPTREGPQTPPEVLDLPALKSISVGTQVACGVTLDDEVICWGELDYLKARDLRALGNLVCSPSAREAVAVPKQGLAALALSPEALLSGAWFLTRDGRVHVREELPQREMTGSRTRIPRRWRRSLVDVGVPARAIDLQAGGLFDDLGFARGNGCVLHFDGRVDCLYGRPATRSISESGAYQLPFTYACALLADGRVACWGDDKFGQAPPIVRFSRPATALAVGADHACALLADQTVSCWGAVTGAVLAGSAPPCNGRCAARTTCDSKPSQVRNLTGVTLLRATPDTLGTCAFTKESWLVCWGVDGNGKFKPRCDFGKERGR
jgi:hypothetical protein